MSWSDSMASSITLTGSKPAIPRQNNHYYSGRRTETFMNPELRRLVRELNDSQIIELPEEEEEAERNVAIPRVEQQISSTQRQMPQTRSYTSNATTPGGTTSSNENSRRSKTHTIVRSLKRKIQRLLHLLSYYSSRLIREYSATAVTYRPLQFGVY